MKKEIVFEIPLPVYRSAVWICANMSRTRATEIYNELLTPVNWHDTEAGHETCASTLVSSGSKAAVIWFPDKKPNLRHISHECVHAAFHVLNACNIELKMENHEALAYLQEYIFEEIAKRLFGKRDLLLRLL